MTLRLRTAAVVAVLLLTALAGALGGYALTHSSPPVADEVLTKCEADVPKRTDELPDFEDLCPEPTQPDASVGVIPPAALGAAEVRKGEKAVDQVKQDFGSPALYSNGRLPKAILCAINSFQSLRCDAARSWVAMRKAGFQLTGINVAPCGGSCAYRDLFNQYRVRREACSRGRCYMAAVPGTSGHGLGTAVDLATTAMRYRVIDRIGARFGWLKRCSDASWEWWHVRFNPACTGATFRPTVAKQCKGLRIRGKCRPTLRKGTRRRVAIRYVQRRLDRECIPTPNHGKWTKRVRTSAKKFQRRAHLRADGVFGARSWRALDRHRKHRHRCQ